MRNPRTATFARMAAAAASVALAPGCLHSSSPDSPDVRKPKPREQCRISFRACAPPASFSPNTDVKRLDVTTLVMISARLDVDDDLAEKAAIRLEKVIPTADEAALLEAEAALDDVATWYGKCRCKNFPSELSKRPVARAVAARLPPRETRSPEYWVDGIVSRIDAVRALRRRTSEEVMSATDAAEQDTEERGAVEVAEAKRGLCEAVKTARRPLSPEAFARLLDMVYARQKKQVGEGSAEVAKRMLDEVKGSTSCEAPGGQ